MYNTMLPESNVNTQFNKLGINTNGKYYILNINILPCCRMTIDK